MANRSMLARATEGTEAPTPGYLYLDIAKNASSSPVATQEIAQYLTRRMSGRTNPNIKYKCLKVIAKTATSQKLFQRTIVQDATAVGMIKECLQFRGPPDPARGDEPYQKVRTAAKEALDAIYSDTPAQSSAGGGMQGIGSSGGGFGSGAPPSANYGGGISAGAAPPGGPGRMEGIGNPMFKDPRQEQQQRSGPPATMDVIREAGRTLKNMIEDPLATRATQNMQQAQSGGGMPGYGGGGYSNPPGRSQLQSNTGGQWNMASNRGPNAVTGNDSYYKQSQPYNWASKTANTAGSAASGGVGGSWGAGGVSSAARQPPAASGPASYSTPTTTATGFGGGGTASSDGQYEKNLILELCPPGGLKAEPPPDKLMNFQQAIPSLNPDLICPVLLDCLEDGQPWIMRGKALRVMKVCIEVGVGEDGVNKYADFFHECSGEIQPLANHNRAAIRDPAKQILELLGLSSGAAAQAAAAPVAAAPAAPAADLLDFGEEEPAAAPPAAAPPAAPSSSSGGSMFGGLQVQGASSSETPAPAASAAPVVQSSSSGGSMFGGLQVQGAPAPAQAAPAPKAEESLLDVMPAAETGGSSFGFMQETPAAAPDPVPPAAGSGFSFMQETPAAAPAAADTGSAFDFMQQQEQQQAPPPPPPPGAPSTPSRSQPATFDPMAQGYQPSPNSANKQAAAAMQQQQQQMAAAMFNQQQMLMMQHQMQQMQVAMARGGQMPAAAAGTNQQPMMAPAGAGMNTTSSFSFLDVGAQPPSTASQEKDKKFDFVKDAIKNHKKK